MRLDWYLHFQCPIYKLSGLAGPFVSGKHYHVSKIVAIAFNVQPPCADMLSKQLNIDTVWAVIWGHLTPQSTMAQWHCLVKDRVPQAYYHSEVSQNGYPKVNIGFNTKKKQKLDDLGVPPWLRKLHRLYNIPWLPSSSLENRPEIHHLQILIS